MTLAKPNVTSTAFKHPTDHNGQPMFPGIGVRLSPSMKTTARYMCSQINIPQGIKNKTERFNEMSVLERKGDPSKKHGLGRQGRKTEHIRILL